MYATRFTINTDIPEVQEFKESIDNSSSWYYKACPKCVKKISEHDGKLICENCDMELKIFDTRYKLVIRVDDDTGSTSLTLFDRDLIPLIGKTPKDIITHLNQRDLNDTVPLEIEGLVGRKFIFRFHITELHLKKGWNKYAVVKLSEDKTLIKCIEKKKHYSKEITCDDTSLLSNEDEHCTPT
ncbi:hypothetical protein ACS0TY_008313 [Phlomoides rotata]